MNIRKSSPLAALAVGAGLALSACSVTVPAAGGTGTVPAAGGTGSVSTPAGGGSGSTAGASGTSATTSTGTGSTTSADGAGRCHSANLDFAWGAPGQSASGGQRSVAIKLTNKGNATCTMHGFPGVDLVNSGQTWSLPRATDNTPGTVTLAPGASATFSIVYRAYEGSGSPQYTPTLAVITPPNETDSYDLQWSRGPLLQDSNTYVEPVS